jgi:hypothetical protein
MNKISVLKNAVLGLLVAMATSSSVLAETLSYFQVGQVYSSPPGSASFNFDITPFDSTLGTLNSVTMTAEVNVSGSAQLWSMDEEAVLTVQFLNTLEAVPEMGWDETVAVFEDSSPLWYYDYDYQEGYVQLDGSGNSYTGPTTITSGFGRFGGSDPFAIVLQLSALVTSTEMGDILVSSYDGDARLTYEYDYTPVPEPSSLALLGLAALALVKARARR